MESFDKWLDETILNLIAPKILDLNQELIKNTIQKGYKMKYRSWIHDKTKTCKPGFKRYQSDQNFDFVPVHFTSSVSKKMKADTQLLEAVNGSEGLVHSVRVLILKVA